MVGNYSLQPLNQSITSKPVTCIDRIEFIDRTMLNIVRNYCTLYFLYKMNVNVVQCNKFFIRLDSQRSGLFFTLQAKSTYIVFFEK